MCHSINFEHHILFHLYETFTKQMKKLVSVRKLFSKDVSCPNPEMLCVWPFSGFPCMFAISQIHGHRSKTFCLLYNLHSSLCKNIHLKLDLESSLSIIAVAGEKADTLLPCEKIVF